MSNVTMLVACNQIELVNRATMDERIEATKQRMSVAYHAPHLNSEQPWVLSTRPSKEDEGVSDRLYRRAMENTNNRLKKKMEAEHVEEGEPILTFRALMKKQRMSVAYNVPLLISATTSTTSKSTSSHQSSFSAGKNAHLRLYQCSLSRQQEGKDRRENIEKARNPIPPKSVIITEDEADKIVERLYCDRGVTFKRQELANKIAKKTSSGIDVEKKHGLGKEDEVGTPNDGIPKQSVRRGMKEKDAQYLFDSLHSENMAKAANIAKQKKENKRFVDRLSEPLTQELFERLYQCPLSRQQQRKARREKIEKTRIATPPKLRRMKEKNAQYLSDRLHSEKITEGTHIMEKEKQDILHKLFERLHVEKKKGGLTQTSE